MLKSQTIGFTVRVRLERLLPQAIFFFFFVFPSIFCLWDTDTKKWLCLGRYGKIYPQNFHKVAKQFFC